jgi:hypothetical protein
VAKKTDSTRYAMPALRFKTCRLLLGNVRKRELTIIQRRILRRLRKKKKSIKRKIYPRENLNSYIQSQTTRKLSLFLGDFISFLIPIFISLVFIKLGFPFVAFCDENDSGSEPSVNQGPQSNGADAGPSGAPSSSSFEEDSFELRVLEESSYGTGTSREGMPVNQQAAIPVPPANPPEAAQEALPQAPAPAEVAHPAPNQEEIAALKRELQGQIQEQIREESERGVGPLSILFPEQRELYSDTAHHIMADLELSTETNVNNLREWVEKLREDKNLLKPLIKDYLPKR